MYNYNQSKDKENNKNTLTCIITLLFSITLRNYLSNN